MSSPAFPSPIKTSDSQVPKPIKVSDSQISDNAILQIGGPDLDRMLSPTANSAKNQRPSTAPTQLVNAIGLQHFPSPNVDPTRPTTSPDQQCVLTGLQEEVTEDTTTAAANASTAATTGDNCSLQAIDTSQPGNHQNSITQTTANGPEAATDPPPPANPEEIPDYSEAAAGTPSTTLPPYDWDSLSSRFETTIAPLRLQEEALSADFEGWTQVRIVHLIP